MTTPTGTVDVQEQSARRVRVTRRTRETDVSITLDLDGSGVADVQTGIGFYDHLLTSLAHHSLIDVESLARALLDAALSPRTEPGPYYVNHPEPVPVAELLTAAEALLGAPSGTRGPAVDVAGARALLADDPFAQHHLDLQ